LIEEFASEEESKGISYKEYKLKHGSLIDPIGASDIYYQRISYRDGGDVWWRLSISQLNFNQLVKSVATANSGPDPMELSESHAFPSTWSPQNNAHPMWWKRVQGTKAKSIHWCFAVGSAERHEGWYFLYDSESKLMWCWHWNHQWSRRECEAPEPSDST
jgi:hypothetical protein